MSKIKVPKSGGSERTNEYVKAVQSDSVVQLNITLPEKKRQQLRMRALQENTTVVEVVNRLIDDYLGG